MITAVFALLFTSGCNELSARRKIQKGNKAYNDGDFKKASELYEEALAKAPHLAIGHHNLGLTYMMRFEAGRKDPDNHSKDKAVVEAKRREFADKATKHFKKYLESNPKDGVIVGTMTRLWLDSSQYDKALEYWEGELKKNKKDENSEIMQILASINRQSGDWEKAIYWHNQEAEIAPTPAAKVKAYVDIGKLAWHRLSKRDKVTGMERLKVADLAIAALQKAEKLAPDNVEVQSYLVSVFNFRALAHGAAWAQAVDNATRLQHEAKRREIMERIQPSQPQQPGQPASPAKPAEKTGG